MSSKAASRKRLKWVKFKQFKGVTHQPAQGKPMLTTTFVE